MTTSKSRTARIEKILSALKNASSGDYSAKLDFASEDDELGLLADAVNKLMQKTRKRLLSSQKTEAVLAEDARRYRHILDNIEESYFEVDLQGNLTFFNNRVISDLGYPPEELRGINFRQFLDQPNAEKVYNAFHQVFLTGLPIKGFDWEIIKKNKDKIQVESSVALRRDEADRPVGFRGIVRDISERTQAQKDLAQSEEKYRTILEIMGEGYFESDLQGTITFVNDAGCRLVGYQREELIGTVYNQYASPETIKRVQDGYRNIYASGLASAMHDYEVVCKDGSIRIHQQNVALMHDESGRPVGFRALVRDVTERKKAEEKQRFSEEKYRNILESMEETYLETDLAGNFRFFNDSLCRLLGYSRAELNTMNYRDCIAPEVVPVIFKIFNDIYCTGEPRTFFSQELLGRDGLKIIAEVSVSLQRDPTGEPTGFHGVARNVTEKVKAEQAIRNRERRFRLITENIRDVIWTLDFDLNYTYLSPSVFDLTGFTVEEVQSMPLKAILPPRMFKGLQERLAEELAREAKGESPLHPNVGNIEMQMLHKTGKPIWVEISASFNRDENGKPFEIVGVTRDISERKKAEETLRESETLYRKALETTSDGVSILQDGKYVYINPQFLKTLGIPEDYAVQETLGTFLHPEDGERLKYYYEKRLRGEPTPGQHDVRALKPDQTLIYIHVTSVDIIYHGKPALLTFMQDITEKKLAEDALRESEKLYRMIVENMQDVIWILDFNLQFKYRSPSSVRITGYTVDELMTIPVKKQLTPESYALAEKVLIEELAREKSGVPFDPHRTRTVELQVYRKDGSTVWIEVTATFNRDEKGEPFEILLAARDIAARKKVEGALRESEQRYRMILENMHEVIWTMDLNLQYTYVSPSCLLLTGHTPDEIMNSRIDQMVTPESMARAATELSKQLEMELSDATCDPHRTITLEQETYHKQGGTIVLEITATFTRDKNGKAVGLLMAGRDITASKKAEEEKSKLEAQLMQAQKMEIVGRLAGGVAHDFNNMLSVIMGYVDLAKMRLAKQHPVLKDIAEIEKAAIRSRDITTQLLAFSRKQIIEPKIIDLNDLVAHTQKALIRLIGEDVELKVVLTEKLWAVKFDPSQVEQILINLAVNARDAMPAGGKLTIETANLLLDAGYCENHIDVAPGEYVRLSFSDNGLGMDTKTLQHIFEPFFTTKDVGKGTGLGLATVYGIVKQNNGFINVYSEPRHGTTFSIYVPRTTEEKAVQEKFEEEPPIEGQGNILLVEDDAMVLQIAKGMLESIGYLVKATSNPLEAIAYCHDPAVCIDLVISDVVMPGLSGKDLRDRLVAIRPDIKVLFISGYTADVIAHHGILEQGVQFLQKPFTIKSLYGKVKEMVAK